MSHISNPTIFSPGLLLGYLPEPQPTPQTDSKVAAYFRKASVLTQPEGQDILSEGGTVDATVAQLLLVGGHAPCCRVRGSFQREEGGLRG